MGFRKSRLGSMMLCQKKTRRIQRQLPNCLKRRLYEVFMYKRINWQMRVQRIKQHHGFMKPCTEYHRIKQQPLNLTDGSMKPCTKKQRIQLQNHPSNWADASMKPSKRKRTIQQHQHIWEEVSTKPSPQQPDWATIPTDVLSVIFNKLGSVGVLVWAQSVCRSWRQLFLNTGEHFWRSVDTCSLNWPILGSVNEEKLAMATIERSGGNVEELHVMSISDDFLAYISERTPKLRRGALTMNDDVSHEVLVHFLSRCPLLEELHFSSFFDPGTTYGDIGSVCPNLKRLLISLFDFNTDSDTEYIIMKERHYQGIGCCEYPNNNSVAHIMTEFDLEGSDEDMMVMEIANSMPQLRELHLLGSFDLTNKGLHAILDKCLCLEFLYVLDSDDITVDNALLTKLAKIKSVRINRMK